MLWFSPFENNPGEGASVPETVILAAVMFSAHETPRACSESAASHRASILRGRWDSRGPPPHQDWLCSARTGQIIVTLTGSNVCFGLPF